MMVVIIPQAEVPEAGSVGGQWHRHPAHCVIPEGKASFDHGTVQDCAKQRLAAPDVEVGTCQSCTTSFAPRRRWGVTEQ